MKPSYPIIRLVGCKEAMHMFVNQKKTIMETQQIIVPVTNERMVHPTIMPERFGSISQPSPTSIVSPELTSVSQPKTLEPMTYAR